MTGLFLTLLATAISTPAPPSCPDIPQRGGPAIGTRLMVTDDLARLRDIGEPTYSQSTVGLSVSPDGRKVAFPVRQADPSSNSYCLSILVAHTDGQGGVHVADRGGTLIRRQDPQWGLGPYPSGNPQAIKPEWSADGRAIAFLKQIDGHVQPWIADPRGSGSSPVATGPSDATALHWASDQHHLNVTINDMTALEAADAREGRVGYHLDDRFVPVSGDRPFHGAPLPQRIETIAVPSLPGPVGTPASGEPDVEPALQRKWLPIAIDDANDDPTIADVAAKAGIAARCRAAACTGRILAAWHAADHSSILFLRRDGRANSDMTLYHWRIGSGQVTKRFRTAGLLLGCEPAGSALICAHEEATYPRRIINLDPQTGRTHLVFDPNPQFNQFRLGKVRRLFWTNDRGIETYGDLVLPPESKAGEKPPLIVTTYRSRGFLRGGTGDEFPVQPLVARGYAVLSFDEPRDIASFIKTRSREEYGAANRKDWANRWSIQSSLEAGIRTVEGLRVTDPNRRGITGLSEGASLLWFSLINSNLFSAAAVSSCCEEPISSMALLGERGARYFEAAGYPLLTTDDRAFWANMSVTRNASRLSTPVLLHLPDGEYLHALESIRALRFFKQPVDAYVFPDEEHIKWQPAHRLAIYDRNIAWFDFWLKGVLPDDQDLAGRWTALRDKKPVLGIGS